MSKNNQRPEPMVLKSNTLAVNSIFPTIQGEGPFSGEPAIFIRLAGCNLQCPNCDTEYTTRTDMTSASILECIALFLPTPNMLIVITGGEPFRQNIKPLIEVLNKEGFRVQIETNGSILPPAGIIWNTVPDVVGGIFMVVSPKTGSIPEAISRFALAFKYPINPRFVDLNDGLPTQILGVRVRPARPNGLFKGRIYITPEDGGDINFTMSNGVGKRLADIAITFGYIAQVQLHKILGVK